MITVHTPAGDRDAARSIRAVLDELVLSYRVVEAGDEVIVEDGDRRIPESQLPGYVAELRRFVAEWRMFQSDACYVADDGSIC